MRSIFLLASLSLALLAAGCGGDDSSKSSGSDGPPTKAEFISQGDKICAKYNKATKALNADLQAQAAQAQASGSLAAVAPTLAAAAKLAGTARDDFAVLEAPTGDESQVKRVNKAIEGLATLLGRLALAAQANDSKTFAELNSGIVQLAALEAKVAKAYGFKECGRTPS